MIDTTEIFNVINSITKNEKKKPSKSNKYLLKDEKHKELQYETFDQVIKNLLLSGTIFTKTDTDITLQRQNINEKTLTIAMRFCRNCLN